MDEIEKARREGIVQGATFAVCLMRKRSSIDQLNNWICERLQPWARNDREQPDPPAIKRGERLR